MSVLTDQEVSEVRAAESSGGCALVKIVARLVAEIERLDAEAVAWISNDEIDIPELTVEVARLRARNEALERVVKAAASGASAVRSLMSESDGVDGYHHNGDIAGWDELERGGRFECIAEFNALEAALSALNPSEQHGSASRGATNQGD